jgi:hypothetical protein
MKKARGEAGLFSSNPIPRSARDHGLGFAPIALRGGDDVARHRALVDRVGIGVADLRADAGRGRAGLVERRGLDPRTRRRAAEQRVAPGAGGTRLKSGGTTSGAWRCTANSSGRSRSNRPVLPHPASVAAPAASRIRLAKFCVLWRINWSPRPFRPHFRRPVRSRPAFRAGRSNGQGLSRRRR